jgi:MFS family permease
VNVAQAEIVDETVSAEPVAPPTGRIRARLQAYPAAVWSMALANLVLWTGRGMTLPFVVIFFTQIGDLPASIVGTGIAISGLGGIAFVMLTAGQIDRRGGQPVLLACIVVIAASTAVYPWATGVLPFLVATIFLNFAGQLYWPASDSTLASISDPTRVAEAMSILRVANAVGIGLGGLIGGALVSGGGLPEYRLMFVISALAIGAASLLVRVTVPSIHLHSRGADGNHGSWRDVFPDRVFIYATGVLFLLVFGFSQLQMSVPAFLRKEAGISEGQIGALFTLNTLIIIITQIPIAARVNRGNLGVLMAAGALCWTGSFGLMLLTPGMGLPAAIAAFLAFTAGELLFMPASAVIPVRLAPLHLRGRYFALLSIAWGGSWAIASLIAGFALDLPEPAVLWPVMAGVMVVGAFAALRMRREPRLAPPA